MRHIDLGGHTQGLWILIDIDIIIMIFMKNSNTKCLQIRLERPQIKVLMQALSEFSAFLLFSLGEEL